MKWYSIYYVCTLYHPPAVEGEERLTRFVFDSGHIDRDGNVKYHPFFDLGGDVSVIRTDGMVESALWQFGEKWVADLRVNYREIKGRVDFMSARLEGVQLAAIPRVPPPKHAEITGWPLEKEARRTKAKLLVSHLATEPRATVSRRPA
jgi:hypothetical protein